jgi:hypothetical protein
MAKTRKKSRKSAAKRSTKRAYAALKAKPSHAEEVIETEGQAALPNRQEGPIAGAVNRAR